MSHTTNSFPLSPMQKGILVDYLSSGHNGCYVQQLLGKIDEPLDQERYRLAWQLLADLHPGLRTCFDTGGEQPVQKVEKSILVDVEFVDWITVSGHLLHQKMSSFLEADRRRGFDIAAPPLFRVTVFQLSEHRYQFVWTSHHLLFDGRSRLRLLKEFYSLYNCEQSLGGMCEPTPYQLFVDRCLDIPVDEARRFWCNAWPMEEDDLSVVEHMRVCSPDRKPGHGILRKSIDRSLSSAIRHIARRQQVGESTLFHAAWALFVTRYTGERWSVFGVTRSCRRGDMDDFVGLCVNTVPLAVNIESDDNLQSLLQRTRKCWRALDPYEQSAVSDIGQWRGNHRGLFDVILNFESRELNEKLRHHGHEWRNREFQLYGITNLPLVISIYAEKKYELEFVYDNSIVDDAMAASIFAQYTTILSQLTGPGDRPLSTIKLVSEENFRTLTGHVDETRERVEQSVTQRFDLIVESRNNAIALSHGKHDLTYGELDRKAGRLAATLVAREIQPGMRVGVLLDRGFEMVASWLGILKSGAVYVPLDTGFPLERIRFITRDAEVALVICDHRYADMVRSLDLNVLLTDSLGDKAQPVPDAGIGPAPGDAAYVMYTSGSTGGPKGVVIPHRGIVRLVCDNDYIAFDPERIFLLHSSAVFDASTFELWGALLNGARCVILEGKEAEIGSLGNALRSFNVDCLWLTTSLFNLVVDECVEILNGVKYLLVGGEDLSVPHVTRALNALPDTRLINGYGPTENTTFSCTFPVPRNFDPKRQHVPIGKPIKHTYVYILDHAGMPVPVGCPGELLIGGAGLAHGYLNRDQLTSVNFIDDPFCSEQGVRVYRSGDICRWLEDGQIEFLGRVDDQQKIRGFRVEPGETNAVLTGHPLVATAATLIITFSTGGKQIESWAVLKATGTMTGRELRDYVAQWLPHFNVPWCVNIIDAMPLTTSGKIDRNKLLTGRALLEPPKTTFPQNALMRMISAIWGEVLGVNGVGHDSDFFELGGDSLSAMRLLQRIDEQVGIRVPLSEFLNASTLESSAGLLLNHNRDVTMQLHETMNSREEFEL